MKKIICVLLLCLFCLPVLAVTLQGNVEQNLSSIKCFVTENSNISIKIKGYPYPPHMENKQTKNDYIFVIDDTNNKVLDIYKHDFEFKNPNVTDESISFNRTFSYDNYKYDVHFTINRLTGDLLGIGSSSDDTPNAETLVSYTIKGTCQPYKIEKKF